MVFFIYFILIVIDYICIGIIVRVNDLRISLLMCMYFHYWEVYYFQSNKLHKLLKYVLDMEFQAADNGNAYESILYACMSVLLKLMPGLTLLKTMFKGRRGNSGV